MSAAAYLQREDLGLRLERVRLIGIGAQDEWKPGSAGAGSGGGGAAGDGLTLPDVTAAGAWIASRLVAPGSNSGGKLDILCLDPDGSLCAWLSSASTQPEIVGVLARQSGSTATDAASGAERPLSPLAFYAATPGEAGVQALQDSPAEPAPKKTKGAPPPPSDRIAVLATSDAAVRLLVDELDRRQITVGSIVSLWQAMAAAWDPSAPSAPQPFPGLAAKAGELDVITPEQRTCTAIVLADPRGRVHWCWTSAGKLMAAGTIRVRIALPPSKEAGTAIVEAETAETIPEAASVMVGPEDAARLTSQWLAWSVQLGRVPSRIICVMTEAQAGSEEAEADVAEFGRQLGASWPGTALDMAMLPDPVAATLLKLIDRSRASPDAPIDRQSLVSLSRRPTRIHRRFYMWTAAAVMAAAGVLGVTAWRLHRDTAQLKAGTQALVVKSRALVGDLDKNILDPVLEPLGVENALETRINNMKREFAPVEQHEMPVLKELDTLSHVIGIPGLQVRELVLDPSRVRLTVVADLSVSDNLAPALRRISGSYLTDWNPEAPRTFGADPNKYEITFTAKWLPMTKPEPAGGA